MNTKLKKKGFTIVELVIVIAVIAILAAVLIPTFANLTKKANLSADKQAVRQINIELACMTDDEPTNVYEVVTALRSVGYDVDNYKALTADAHIYWVKSENRVILANDDKEILYPEDSEITYKMGDWYALDGEIALEDYTIVNTTEVTITSAGQLASFMTDWAAKNATTRAVETLKIDGDIDMMGGAYNISAVNSTQTLTIEGVQKEDGTYPTIYGLRADTYVFTSTSNNAQNIGFISQVTGTVTIKNLNFSGMISGRSDDTSTANVGILIGSVTSTGSGSSVKGGSATIENVTVSDSASYGENRIGGICGNIGNYCTLTTSNVAMTNVSVTGGANVASVVGQVMTTKTNVSFDVEKNNVSVSHYIYIYADDSEAGGLAAEYIAGGTSVTGSDGVTFTVGYEDVYYQNLKNVWYLNGSDTKGTYKDFEYYCIPCSTDANCWYYDTHKITATGSSFSNKDLVYRWFGTPTDNNIVSGNIKSAE